MALLLFLKHFQVKIEKNTIFSKISLLRFFLLEVNFIYRLIEHAMQKIR
jgi:hypothetical protein